MVQNHERMIDGGLGSEHVRELEEHSSGFRIDFNIAQQFRICMSGFEIFHQRFDLFGLGLYPGELLRLGDDWRGRWRLPAGATAGRLSLSSWRRDRHRLLRDGEAEGQSRGKGECESGGRSTRSFHDDAHYCAKSRTDCTAVASSFCTIATSSSTVWTGKVDSGGGRMCAYGFEDGCDKDGNSAVGHGAGATGMNGDLRIYPKSG